MTALIPALLAVAALVGPFLFVLVDDRPRPVDPPALAGQGTGVEQLTSHPPVALPRSPMAQVGVGRTPDLPAFTGPATRVGVTGRQTATPTRHQAVGHG